MTVGTNNTIEFCSLSNERLDWYYIYKLFVPCFSICRDDQNSSLTNNYISLKINPIFH